MFHLNDEDYRHDKIETAKQKVKESYHNNKDYRIKYKKNQKQRYSTVQVYREVKIETAKQKITVKNHLSPMVTDIWWFQR
jgi:cytochrome c biogenesis factor